MTSKINKSWIENWAGRYDYDYSEGDETREDRILKSVRELGRRPAFLTKPVVIDIVRWKSPRSTGYAEDNSPELVEDVTRASFSAETEELKIGALTLMNGVGYRVASAILYFCDPERYTIMDWRAWASLKAFGEVEGEIEDSFRCWQKYNEKCCRIAKRNRVSLRTLDKALWKYKGGDDR
jgi:hypothetical protein